ncbi:MAG: glutamate formimidoyltransferase [Candidatus Dormibacterales bacterium]
MSVDLFESVPNFSEGTDPKVLGSLAAAVAKTHVLDLDADVDHNRAVLTLADTSLAGLTAALLGAVRTAVRLLDIGRHRGVHPRVGVADVVPLVPLGDARMEDCVRAVRDLGSQVWEELGVPVYLYGRAAASPERATLAAIRSGRIAPDLGEAHHPTAGACCIGARPPLVAYNVRVVGGTLVQAAGLASALRASSGGLPGVQALAFPLPGGGIQLSMNLVDLRAATPASVHAELVRLAARADLELGEDQVVGLCPAAAADRRACDGRLLEARLAAAGAAAGARRCRESGRPEQALVAGRLESEAAALQGMGAGPEELLQGAERSVAAADVLRAARALTGEAESLLMVAARGFRAALGRDAGQALGARVGALDRRLEGAGGTAPAARPV